MRQDLWLRKESKKKKNAKEKDGHLFWTFGLAQCVRIGCSVERDKNSDL